jgi:hypothetical protein
MHLDKKNHIVGNKDFMLFVYLYTDKCFIEKKVALVKYN